MTELMQGIGAIMDERRKVATGETKRSMTTEVNSFENIQGQTFGITARLSANANWKWVGNGRGPGGMPPVANIQRWIDAKGLSLSAWAVAKRIAKDGSLDHRRGNTNVFDDGIAEWQSNTNLIAAAEGIAESIGDTVVVDLQTALR